MKRMKKRLLAMLLALMLVVGLLPVGVLAVGASNEYGSLEYNHTNQSLLQGTLRVVFQDANGQPLGNPIVVTDYEKTLAAENKITLTGDEYEIAEISASNGTLTSVSVNGTTGSFRLTFSNADSATVYVTLAEPFDKDDVVLEGEEIGHGGTVYFNINDYEIYKMLYIAGVSVPASTEIDSVKLRYVKENQLLETEDFVELSGFISTEYVDYWQADASNGSGLATPYNVRQLEIEHHDTTTVIPYTALKYTRDGDHYWIEARNDAPYIVAFYNETSADSGNDYTLYDIRYVDISGETVAENGGMPADPDYPNTTYQFVAWTDGYDGGKPFIETTPVTEDTVVYAQKTLSTKASEIHVMNDGELFKDRIQELYGRNDIKWDSVKVSVYAEDGSHTNPDYNISPNENGWRGNYYFVYNYLSGVGEQDNDSIFINDITHIVVTATAADGSDLGSITINKGIYDGDFSVSTGAQGSSYIIELYINDNGVEDPDDDDDEPTPPEPVAKLDVDKAVAIPDGKGTAAVGDVLEYTVTITNNSEVDAEDVMVTDTMWESGSSVKIDGKDGTLQYVTADGEGGYCVTVDVPASGSVVIYYTYTVQDADAGNSVGNTVTVGEMTVTTSTTVDEAEELEPTPDKPRDPTEAELNQLYVDLECINEDAQHADKRFHLDLDNSVVIVDFTTGICTVQPNYGFILATYNKQVADGHTYADDAEKTLMLTWDGKNKTWIVAGDVASITRQVKCETPEQPDDDDEPNPPTEEDLEDDPDDSNDPAIFKGDNIVVIDCINPDKTSHTADHYRLFPQTYTIGEVKGDKTSGYTCDITIRPGDYIIVYEKTFPYHGLAEGEDDTKTVTLKWVDDAWTLPENAVPVTFQVTCDTEHIKDTDYIYVEKDPEDPTDPDQTGVADLLETDDHIQYLFGYPDDSFGPDRNMTRAEAAQMFYNLLKNKNVDAEPAFDDVPDGAWYATPVNVMAELGIVNGVGDDKFEPNREITRAEFTTMAMRFAKVPSGGVNIFTDVKPSDWFYSYVVNSIQYGWIEGYGDGTFRPNRLITRAEVTTIVNRMLDRQADMAFVIQNRDKLTKFTDLTTEHWAYYTIVEATNEHNYKKPAIGEDWTSLIK